MVIASLSAYHYNFKNRIERQFDEASQIFFSVNVGKVRLQGFDGQIGFKPNEIVSFYGSLSYSDSEIRSDFPNGVVGGVTQFLPTKGKSLSEAAKWQGAASVDVKPFENFSVGISGKFIGDRFTNLTNTEKFNGYALWDMYARYKVEAFNAKDTYLQLNVKNLFDERYLGNIVTNITGTGQGEPGYGRSVIATLHVEF